MNQATYSSELCEKLFDIYGTDDYIVYDPYIGTGTAAVACKKKNMLYIGSEISNDQRNYAEERLKNC